jgi:hypothetical protein
MAANPPAAPRKGIFKSPVTWVIIAGAVVVIGAIYWWRSSQAAGSSTATAGTTAADAGTTSADDAGAVDTLQTEIGDLQSSAGQVSVPNVTGATAAEATTIIKAAGLHPANPKGTPGTAKVTGTSPAAGTQVASGSVVSITSSGAATTSTGTSKSSPDKADERSWTDTGQKWTIATLARNLGISRGDLHPANQSAADAYDSKSPLKLIPKGAHFTYTKAA